MDKVDIIRVNKFIEEAKADIPLCERESIADLIMKYKLFEKYYKVMVSEYENKNKVYTYMLTFTIDPKKHDVNDIKLHDIIEEYVVAFARKRNASRADFVKEGTDEAHLHTHWHLGLELKKYIDFSNFLKFYRKTYGICDITRSWSNRYENVMDYINKSNPSTELANNNT